jgi:serine/threonine protein kinase
MSQCPDERELEAMLLGRIPPARTAELQRHLDVCPDCPAKANGLRLESRLMKLLAGRAPDYETGGEMPPALQGLMKDLESLHSDASPHSNGDDENESGLLPPLQAGELGRLGDYRVLELLGRGGMGAVYLAEDTRLERLVGLKVLQPRRSDDPGERIRFLREARAMAAVRHDNIAVIHEVGVVEGAGKPPTLFLAMERLEGQSLLEWMQAHRRPPVPWIVRIGRESAAGLAAAHSRGLIHRDIKPGNLWLEAPPGWIQFPGDARPALGEVGRVKLIDFGLATPHDPQGRGDSLAAGTLAYMAPEQFAGGPVDGRADLFSLGCVLYELATGDSPFPGRTAGNRPGVVHDPVPTAARDLNPQVPMELSELIARMLAANPADRPATARDVESQLARMDNPPAPRTSSWAGKRVRIGIVIAAASAALAWFAGTIDTVPTPPGEGASRRSDWGDRAPFPAGPPDDLWCRRVAELPSQEQFRTVAMKVEELNPGYESRNAAGWVEVEGVIRFTIVSDVVHDIRPVRGLPDVRNVRIAGTEPGRGILADLSPLVGLRLHTVSLENHPRLTDLSPLSGIRLSRLTLKNTGVRALDAIDGSILEELSIAGSPIIELEPLREMQRLHTFDCVGCPVQSLEPISACPIRHLRAEIVWERDEPILRNMAKLSTINGIPAKDFLRAAPGRPNP